MEGVDLSNLDLRNINFKCATLRGCNLSNSDLTNCVFERADLTKATLDVSTIPPSWSGMERLVSCNNNVPHHTTFAPLPECSDPMCAHAEGESRGGHSQGLQYGRETQQVHQPRR